MRCPVSGVAGKKTAPDRVSSLGTVHLPVAPLSTVGAWSGERPWVRVVLGTVPSVATSDSKPPEGWDLGCNLDFGGWCLNFLFFPSKSLVPCLYCKDAKSHICEVSLRDLWTII